MQEIWKPINKYKNLYYVSNKGNIFSVKSEKILHPHEDKKGYKRIKLSRNGTVERFLVHRLVAEHFIPNPNGYKFVNHKDEKPSNNNVENLEWCTHEYNMNYGTARKRAIEKLKGRFEGANNPRAKQVYFIEGQKIFRCGKYASEELNINYKNLKTHLEGNSKSCTENKLHFIYVVNLLQNMTYIPL